MTQFKFTMVGITLALAITACAGMSGAPVKFKDGVMTDGAGMTLYTYEKDTAGSGKSVCNGQCVTTWPPLMAKADDKAGGSWSIIVRDEGARQWAYEGRPLYLYARDQSPGDRIGDGPNWHVIKQPAEKDVGYRVMGY